MMSSPPLSERQREALREIIAAAAERSENEPIIRAEFESRQRQFYQECEGAKEQIGRFHRTVKEAARKEFVDVRTGIVDQFNQDYRAAGKEYAEQKRVARNRHSQNKESLYKEFKESRWSIGTIYDSRKKTAKETRAEQQNLAETRYARIKNCVQKAELWLAQWGLQSFEAIDVSDETSAEGDDPCDALKDCASSAEAILESLRTRTVTPWMRWKVLAPTSLGVWLGAAVPMYFLMEQWIFGIIGAAVLTIGLALVLRFWLYRSARLRSVDLFAQLLDSQENGGRLRQACLDHIERTYRKTRTRILKDAKNQSKQIARKLREQMRASRDERDIGLADIESTFLPQFEAFSQRRSNEIGEARKKYRAQKEENRARRDAELQDLQLLHKQQQQLANQRHASAWLQIARAWKTAVERFARISEEVHDESEVWFPDWEHFANGWTPPDSVPRGIRIGLLRDVLTYIPDVQSSDVQMPALALPFEHLPALLPFPEQGSLLLKSTGEGRQRGAAFLQSLLFRCATALPPGKVRFTILDPVGRGENFAAFMHLADYEPLAVNSRIWTEPGQLDQRLLDLTDHIENVIQKYLRNEYKTLEEYNAQAGEMAEPYRILVVADFPVNFSVDACRRLVSLASSGARCGVYTFISYDEQQPLPHGVEIADLEQACTVMPWRDGDFGWNDPDFCAFPLQLDEPPGAEAATKLLHEVGQCIRDAGRVEVPFAAVAPNSDEWWTGDSRRGIAIPLGKAGAIDKQYLRLGEGTAQHALVAGKTGSGKSTLLHALIVQLSLHYHPDEVQMYLIDFKKGVEFKTYAVHQLPHAAVVAVESEREFGLSVLKRLDEELQRRGELYRKAGVTDLPAFRDRSDANGEPTVPLPRILLVVDEFQEFFVEEDKLAQEASLLFDRLVRQGRAFGMHVLLGSQTLGGAYSLARSTLDQMAVRIALQCSESDGHLVLSKDNSAARLLTRPGEAIYNASNGAMEGNSLFQVVWLPDQERDGVLRQVQAIAQERGVKERRQIVFEGTAPSDLRSNPFLDGRQQAAAQPPPWRAWLGEAVAIKDPTAAVFPLQSGANLLLVGQQPEAAFQVLVAAMVGLTAQNPRTRTQPWMHLVTGASLEGRSEQFHAQLPDLLGPSVRCWSMRELPELLAYLASAVDRRLKETDKSDPKFLILHGIQRMRDLRRAEDDFGFSRRDEEQATPDRLFQYILTEGPAVGIFTLLWCDTLPNLNRVVDRRMMREFEMRVLFQMNANDSSALIDDPSASKLGPYRALFYSEDQGRLEKFRPYGLPDAEWVRGVLGNEQRE